MVIPLSASMIRGLFVAVGVSNVMDDQGIMLLDSSDE
jgi:hypothetical protein